MKRKRKESKDLDVVAKMRFEEIAVQLENVTKEKHKRKLPLILLIHLKRNHPHFRSDIKLNLACIQNLVKVLKF